MIAELKQLWAEAFGDSREAIDDFFATGFSKNRHHCILRNIRKMQIFIYKTAVFFYLCPQNKS